jgi:probable selenium-dependent hydroxylase accessory protein YqeC
VITTTTTKILPPHPSQSPHLIVTRNEQILLKETKDLLAGEFHVTLAGEYRGEKLNGLSPVLIDTLQKQEIADVILVEADGAKQCPLKAPNQTEPVIPSSTTWTLAVVGLDGIGKPNTEEYVFRPHYFAHLTGIKIGEVVTPEALARIILHPEGLVRGNPLTAKTGVILNKGDVAGGISIGTEAAMFLRKKNCHAVAIILITSLLPTPKVMMAFPSE